MTQPTYWQDACAHLTATDATLAKLIAAYPDCILTKRSDAFTSLARAIVGQQISVKAADAVWGRVLTTVGATDLPQPAAVRAATPEQLRAAGLSMRKVGYIQALAEFAHHGHLQPQELDKLDDAAIINELTALPGIGPWTAEMFLIFHLQRPDVFPLDDIGLLNAIDKHYPPKPKQPKRKKADYRKLGESWRPFRTVATWYLWRSLDPHPVEY